MLSQTLWHGHQDLVEACLNHPFVQGIKTGDLKREQFAFYVGQDAFFLEAFARAYSITAAKAPDWFGFCRFHQLAQGVLTELNLHQAYANQWQVNLQEVQPASATRRYVDFLLATAWGSEVGFTAVAMSPCMRLYAFLGQQLAKNGIPSHAYRDWIETYSEAEFEQLAQQLEELSDRYNSLDNREQLHQIYRYALLCERDFFTEAWNLGL